ncbi:hypothetical protein QUF64_11850 [Anaerolineales bacterium HSG6]|nr:hypothetical protein [Anaerolineales bacterium HSG6]MDM8532137.1 hypothetical protein [Anaerolineales bacterium HSG25]
MKNFFNKKHLARQEGQGLVEYALLLVLVSIVVIGILLVLGPQIRGVFEVLAWNLGHRDPFSGDVDVTGTISVTAQGTGGLPGGGCANRSDIKAIATFSVTGADGPVRGIVKFQHLGGGNSTSASGESPLEKSGLGTGGNKTIKACLQGVVGYNLANSPVCAETTASC